MQISNKVNLAGAFKMVCPYCKHPAEVSVQHRVEPKVPGQRALHVVGVFATCRTCENPIMLRIVTADPTMPQQLDKCDIFPPPTQTADPDIPDKIRAVFQEALNCAGIKAWNAVGTMSRRAIQEAILEKQGQGKDLFKQIEDLKTKGLLADPLVRFAHRVRVIGRDAAHADAGFIDLDQTDAEDVIEFCRAFFDALYATPKRLDRQEAKRPG